jgi:hypothetical protein
LKTDTKWNLEEARKHLDTVIKEALDHGPQRIVLKGKRHVMVVAVDASQPAEATDSDPKHKHLLDLVMNSPLRGANIEFQRIRGRPREVDLGDDE